MANTSNLKSGQHKQSSLMVELLKTYTYMALWVVLSAIVILINKYILAYAGFPYPIALTLTHMAFCSSLAMFLVKTGIVSEPQGMDFSTYMSSIVPVAALFAATLWLGNAAYMYLSVSFIQMVKALMPVTVFMTGVLLATETYTNAVAMNMIIVGVGVGVASYGELEFNMVGIIYQLSSVLTESFRLALIQILLQRKGIKLNPITTLYYIAPACFFFLCIPFSVLELPMLMHDEKLLMDPALLLGSAAAAFALNMAVFLLIGKTSALTMNVAGVIKDWLLIAISVLLYKSKVTPIQLAGYAVAFLGVCWYNYSRIKQMTAAENNNASNQAPEKEPLLPQTRNTAVRVAVST